jgi:RNA polymerase sigma-70 factor (ECF subfamily)
MTLFSSFRRDETDEQLMECFAFKNSEKAFEELYRRYASRFKGFFMRMLSADGALADDFQQELFLRIYEARSSYQYGRQFSTWAFAMAYNLCKNEYRHRDIIAEYRLQQSYIKEEEDSPSSKFEVAYDRQVFDQQLKKVLAGLTDEQRAAYTLRYEEELPVQEIAQILCCPEIIR